MSKRVSSNLRCNEQIRVSPVRLIGSENEQIGILPTEEALKTAREANLDLVEVAPTERPPVCRIMDYGRYKYHQRKHQKKRHHEQQLKEVRMRPKTDPHDRAIKMDRALKFLRKGDKVQFTMQFRGRERAHREIGVTIFQGVIAEFGERIKVERPPSMDGRHMIMILTPNKPVLDEEAAQKAAKSAPPESKKNAEPVKQAVAPTAEVAPPAVSEPDAAKPDSTTEAAPQASE